MKIHPVFHVSLLDPAPIDPVPGQIQPPPPPVVIDNKEEFHVEEIYDSKITKSYGLQYLVKWKGENTATWEPAINLDETSAVDQFHELYPQKPGPLQNGPNNKPRRSSRLKRRATFMD